MKQWLLLAILVVPLAGCTDFKEIRRLRDEMKTDSVGERDALPGAPGRSAVE